MRCRQVRRLLDRFVDQTLEPRLSDQVARHLESCERCARELSGARKVAAVLASGPMGKAPADFRRRVMDEVYREAMTGQKSLLPNARQEPRRWRFYRRLGLSFVASAVILGASLAIPRASYPSIIASQAVETGLSAGPVTVRMALLGADRAVQDALRPRTR